MSKYPGKTTADDWDGKKYTFWLKIDHGTCTGLVRRKKDKSPSHENYVYCDEHKEYEVGSERITPTQALKYVNSGETPEIWKEMINK